MSDNSYYHKVLGNLNAGDIAKSSDIHHIQENIEDALKALLFDLHDGESYILGNDENYKNSFILTAAPKKSNEYIDSENVFEVLDDFININYNDVRQPILKTKTSLYSIITKLRNTSNKDIPVTFELQDEEGEVLRSNTVTLKKNTPSEFYEIIFDLDYYPTPPTLSYDDLIKRDGKDVPSNTEEESYDEGFDEEYSEEDFDKSFFTVGVSKLYFVIKRTNLNAVDLVENINDNVIFDPEKSLGVYCRQKSLFPDKDIHVEINSGNGSIDQYEKYKDNSNIYYQDVYAKEMTYLCTGGSAIIQGERVDCLDTHISVEGGSSAGNILTQVYLGSDGHLHAANRKASTSTDIDTFENDPDDPVPPENLPIALILTYWNAQYGTAKEPLIIQDDYDQKPRSHHERLRRLEKQMNWSNDIALPARLKYTISDGEWVDKNGNRLVGLPHSNATGKDYETIEDNVVLTTDENGNVVVKLNKESTETISVTLKEKFTDKDGNKLKLEETNPLNASSFATIEHMKQDSKKGTLVLDQEKSSDKDKKTIATSKKEAKETKYNLWDDSAANRPTGKNIEKHEREYKVVSGKNGSHDKNSYYPGMTFYTKTNYKMKKLYIPIHKFHNCSKVKFFIWKRQESNNKKNTVWLKKLYKSKTFSLKKAKVKGKYQYMDDGFTLNFGKDGLSLPKGQYVIIALPVPKSGTGSLFVETYKPKNSKDFCIKYVGAANASHFRLAERYQEIWYNSASAILEEEDYYKKGTVISKTLKFNKPGLARFTKVKPILNNNITYGSKSKDSYELYVDTGGGWIKVTPGNDNVLNKGGGTTFKWKLVFKGDGKSTPKLKYNKKTGYAIRFILTRDKPAGFIKDKAHEDYNKNMCITSKIFDGDKILREYLGDMNFALTNSRFQGYEFARIWAEKELNENLLIDIQGSDREVIYKDNKSIDFWSMHYCDLTLEDFEKISVDYSDYTEELEYDENNMKLKLDSEHSYNDDDIQIIELHEFSKTPNSIDNTTEEELTEEESTEGESTEEDGVEKKVGNFVDNKEINKNQLFMKKTFNSPIDLTKYTGLKFKFKVETEEGTTMTLKGLGLYISTVEEKNVPSNLANLPENLYETPLKDADVIPLIIDPDESPYSYYEGKLIQILHEIDPKNDGNKIYKNGFYQYVKIYDTEKEKYIYKRQQVFDLRNYSIYNFGDITITGEDNTFEVRVEIDQNSNNLKYVKEIGIITLNDEAKYGVNKNSIETKMVVTENNGSIYVTLKDKDNNLLPGKRMEFWKGNTFDVAWNSNIEGAYVYFGDNLDTYKQTGVTVKFPGDGTYSGCSVKFKYNQTTSKYEIEENTSKTASDIDLYLTSVRAVSEENLKIYDPEGEVEWVRNPQLNDSAVEIFNKKAKFTSTTYGDVSGTGNPKSDEATDPVTTQVCIKHTSNGLRDGDLLCYINNPYSGGLTNYKHLGIQLASDVYIPKDCVLIDVCSKPNGESPIASVNLPTIDSIYYPNQAGNFINLSQVFKKINIEDEEIRSIAIRITPHFKNALKTVLDGSKPAINLFIGKIVLYRARTIPMYHRKMRFKFYNTENGEIQHNNSEMSQDTFSIRKIGAVLDYD